MRVTSFGNGEVRFLPGDPGQPETRETRVSENLTVNLINAARPERPDAFEVTFLVMFSYGEGDFERHGNITLSPVVPRDGEDPTYFQLEGAAARQLPDLLRSLAEAVAAELQGTETP